MCTGNICRSPAVERLLRAGLDGVEGLVVTSAGTSAVVGAGVSAPMVPLMEAAGATAGGFVARRLTAEMVREADLVLPLTRAHRSAVVQLWPAAVRRTFVLRELARLAAVVDPGLLPDGPVAERLAALVPLAASRRSRHVVTAEDEDVVDPYGGDETLYRTSFEQLRPAVDAIVRVALGPAVAGRRTGS